MNTRSSFLSRLTIVSIAAVCAAGCARAEATGTTHDAAQQAQAAPASSRGPGHRVFRQIEALDLSDDQRVAIADVEEDLAADLAPHRETIHQVVESLASAVETGAVDPQDLAAQQAALLVALDDMKGSVAVAMNAVHDRLDAAQRAELVEQLQAERLHHHGLRDRAHHDGRLAKLALELGLTEDQKQSIHDAIRSGVEQVFPDRKAKREAMEAKMKALAEAFVSDDFDAADFDLGAGAEEGIPAAAEIAAHAVDVTGRVLTASQRRALASMIRERAARR